MSKLKVAWICHFSNKDVRERLPISKMKLYNFIQRLFRKTKHNGFTDFAPWVTNFIKEFERFDNIELHIIAPHAGLTLFKKEFEMNGIHYHFFQSDLPIFHFNIPNKLLWKGKPNFIRNRYFVKRFLLKIKPDIVNLIGTENPYYSITTLDIVNLPVFVSAQTVYTNPNRLRLSGSCSKLNWDIELKIHKKEKYFGCGGRMHRDLILNNNPDAIIFKNLFSIQKPSKVVEVTKEFDFVFFAAVVNVKKGIEDALDALALVKKVKKDVTLNVVGMCTPNYLEELVQKINTLDIKDNISFNNYFPLHADMHQHIKKAKFAVLPIKLDDIPSTVIEAMLLELPVVSYKTTGTPYLNKDIETILLAEIGDISMLATNMIRLLNEPDLCERLKKEAKAFIEKDFDNTQSAKRLADIYPAVINHYHNNIPISNELLFSTEEFPIYK